MAGYTDPTGSSPKDYRIITTGSLRGDIELGDPQIGAASGASTITGEVTTVDTASQTATSVSAFAGEILPTEIDHVDVRDLFENVLGKSSLATRMAALCCGNRRVDEAGNVAAIVRRAWVHALKMDVEKASVLTRLAERALLHEHGLRVEIELLWAFIHIVNDNNSLALARALSASRQATDPEATRLAATLCRAAHWRLGDIASFEAVDQAIAPASNSRRSMLTTMLDRTIEAAVAMHHLHFSLADRLARGAVEMASKRGRSDAAVPLPTVIRAQIAYENGSIGEADAILRSILPCIRAGSSAETAVRAYTTLARAAIAETKYEFAIMILREGEGIGEQRGWRRLSAACLAERIGLLADLGRIEEAQTLFERLSDQVGGLDEMHASLSGRSCLVELARCRMEMAQRPSADAAVAMRALVNDAISRGDLHTAAALAVRLVDSLVLAGELEMAAEAMCQIVEIGCSAGLFQTIIDGGIRVRNVLTAIAGQAAMPGKKSRALIATILQQWPEPSSVECAGRGERRSDSGLTPREESVLRLMSLGHSNKLIAQRLGIAPETVKSHAKNLYTRLGASTRAEAVSRAASLGML